MSLSTAANIAQLVSLVSLLGGLVVLVRAAAAWRRAHECHVETCHHLAWGVHPDHEHPVCREHQHPSARRLVEHPEHGSVLSS